MCPSTGQTLADEIAQRVGDQPLCYVKVYAAKNGSEITGECRINDVRSEELSQRVAELAAQWDTEGFGSHKQFFFLRQAEETRLDYPWTRDELKEKTRAAVRLLHELIEADRQEQWAEALDETAGDEDPEHRAVSFSAGNVCGKTISRPSLIRRP